LKILVFKLNKAQILLILHYEKVEKRLFFK
jgi:hypothetical protein